MEFAVPLLSESLKENVKRTRGVLVVFLIALGMGGRLRASEEEILRWSEVRIVGAERKDTGKVGFLAKMAGEPTRK